ncbi:sigma 54-interacting transcriptional regulator [Psychroserpens mesophilus]|uniref:sigma 54-interacting transcriptional regulator n=1 Tax=Psychroserpens mesophilus TaxID=325473 RepID=UPI003D64DC36
MSIQLKEILSGVNPNKFNKILNENALICLTDLHGEFVYVSNSFCLLLGLDEAELLSSNLKLLNSSVLLEGYFSKHWWKTITKDNHWEGSIDFYRKDGVEQNLICSMSLIEDSESKQSYYLWLFSLNHADIQYFLTKDLSYKWFFKNSPLPKSILNLKELHYTDVNESWENYTGFKRDFTLDQNPEKLKFYRLVDLDFMRMIQSGKISSYALNNATLMTKSGEKKYAVINYEKIFLNGEAFLLEVIIDATDSVNYQKELKNISKKSLQKKDAILKLVGSIGKEFSELLKDVTSICAKVLDVKRVSVWKFNEDQSAIQCQNDFHLDPDTFKNDTTIYVKDCPNYFKTLYKQNVVKIDDVSNSDLNEDFINEYLKPMGISSSLDVFINGADGYFGIICFEHIGDPRKWTVEEEEFAITIGSIVTFATENFERKKTETKLLLEKEFSEELVGSLMEGLSVVDLDEKLIRVNQALCTMTGFTKKELIGDQPPFKYWPPEYHDKIIEAFYGFKNGEYKTRELIYMRKNGERFPVSLAFSFIKDKKGENLAYFATITDISERKKEERLLKKRAEVSRKRKEAISKLVSMIGQDYMSTLKHTAKVSSEVLNVDQVSIWKFKNDEEQLLSKVYYNSKKEILDDDILVINKTDFPEYFKALGDKSILNISDINSHSITKAYSKAFNIDVKTISRLDAVIHSKNKRYGLISFESYSDERTYSDEEENFATSIANIISLMVESRERIAAENQLTKTNEKLLKLNSELNKYKKELEQENTYLREEIDLSFNYEEMVYGSKSFSQVLTDVERVAATNATVLLLGESGTGKELLARAIHNTSARMSKPLIKVNCAAIPKELIESEFFGHKKGAFTGAINDKPGKFELADGGTLFLDEIGELPLEMQPKLLRAIQESEIEPIGGNKTLKVDIRIIAATNRDLKKEIKEKNFREDLYFRINVFPITIPPLRERVEDIPILIDHFVNKYSKLYNKTIKYISESAKTSLKSYSWPGNIRELENLMERAVILSKEEKLIIPNFQSSAKKSLISSTALSLDDVQRIHIKKILKKCNWKIGGSEGAATLLQIKPSTLRDRIKKLKIEKP